MRALGVAFVLTLRVGVAAASDIVVLSNGDRMDVESYEIQKNAVLVKTWDGRYRSLPITYVNVEATEKANDRASAAEKIAPERLAKARQACDAYGIRVAVAVYRNVLDGEIQKLRGLMSIMAFDQVRAAFRNAFDDERNFDAVVAHFAQNANLDLLDSWAAWLETPFAERMVAMESGELTARDTANANQYYLALTLDDDAYARRLGLTVRLDDARHTTESGIEVVLHLVEAFLAAGRTVFPDETIEYDESKLRETLTPILRETNADNMILLYREASDEELEDYISYWKSVEGQRIVDLVNAAVESGAMQGSAIAMEILAGTRHTVP